VVGAELKMTGFNWPEGPVVMISAKTRKSSNASDADKLGYRQGFRNSWGWSGLGKLVDLAVASNRNKIAAS
jgi:hypothetical protein